MIGAILRALAPQSEPLVLPALAALWRLAMIARS